MGIGTMWTVSFWKATAERAIRTFAQSLAAVLVAGATNLLDVDWAAAFGTAGLATLLAVLTAVGTAGVGPHGPGILETPAPKAAPERPAA
ncbi:holin [Streptomyces sp. VRA16 Mangrove soil]|uniref:holin n=1 Tax=Streptomyces sp. VRA16 Mangrove soil TaxID=2817434 RepID=UPI001A9EBE4C|nr:holin [Streptomyces sp. VRA16 Mangrove soil]MBO1332419.1 holin [Streptomyces sp. VRA16 Mangrove soil]